MAGPDVLTDQEYDTRILLQLALNSIPHITVLYSIIPGFINEAENMQINLFTLRCGTYA